MHLAARAYLLVLLTAVLVISAIWSSEPPLTRLWRVPAVVLLAGLAFEGFFMRRAPIPEEVESAPRAFLGRPQPAAFVFRNHSTRPLEVQYAPALPVSDEAPSLLRRVRPPARGMVRDALTLLPVPLVPQPWPSLPARVLGPLGFAWWGCKLQPAQAALVAPDALRTPLRPRGLRAGIRPRRVVGAGAELHQLRAYVRGDPLARIDWKAAPRSGPLFTREFNKD